MTTCDLCGCDLFRAESVTLRACLECRLVITNENEESLSDKRRRVVAQRLSELDSG